MVFIFIKDSLEKIKGLFFRGRFSGPYFKLLKVQLSEQKFIFQVRGKALTISGRYDEIIQRPDIVNNLSPVEACYIGGFFGRTLKMGLSKAQALRKMKSLSFLLDSSGADYQISFQDRVGNVGYFEKETLKEFVDSPVSIAKNDYLLSKFGASQSCYIGILAGIAMEKKTGLNSNSGKQVTRPALKLVK